MDLDLSGVVLAQSLGQRLQPFTAARHEDEVVAAGGEALGIGRANPRGRARNEGEKPDVAQIHAPYGTFGHRGLADDAAESAAGQDKRDAPKSYSTARRAAPRP